ncbi:MAG: hypothetical protein RMJ88_16435 [Thermogemmata sp.]|nr:hypothetical protein [Thermogemmata sp.]
MTTTLLPLFAAVALPIGLVFVVAAIVLLIVLLVTWPRTSPPSKGSPPETDSGIKTDPPKPPAGPASSQPFPKPPPSRPRTKPTQVPGDPEDDIPGYKLLKSILEPRRVMVDLSRPPSTIANGRLKRVVEFMGRQYKLVHPIVRGIKQHANNKKRTIKRNMSHLPQCVRKQLIGFCQDLKSLCLIQDFVYQEEEFRINIIPAPNENNRKFFDGHWLEQYVALTAKKILADTAWKFGYYNLSLGYWLNLSLILPDNKKCELDGFAVVGQNAYWIEAKTGDCDQDIRKFAKLGKALGIKPERYFIVQVDYDESKCKEMRVNSGIQVCTLKQFPEMLKERLVRDLSDDLGDGVPLMGCVSPLFPSSSLLRLSMPRLILPNR